MKAKPFCILLTLIVIVLLSTTAQAAEYRKADKEVNASDILSHIEKGNDINLYNCSIVGDLDTSKIKLKTVSNQRVYSPVYGSVDEYDELNFLGALNSWENKNFHLIENNISITNSNFEDNVNFSYVIFNGSVDFHFSNFNRSVIFGPATFNNYVEFVCATFNNYADFSSTTFNISSDFNGATFNHVAFGAATFNNQHPDFSNSKFNGTTYFTFSRFNHSADFSFTTFKDIAHFNGVFFNHSSHDFSYPVNFGYTTFEDYADFRFASFNNYGTFWHATFNSADFEGATFNDDAIFEDNTFDNSAVFTPPDTSGKIYTDQKACEFFRKAYNNLARYTDADNVYYTYRKQLMDKESLSFTKVFDILSWVTCGFGTKLKYTTSLIVVIIIFFAFLYKNPGLSLLYWIIGLQFIDANIQILKPDEYRSINKENKTTEITFKLYWGKPGIYRLTERTENKKSPSNLDFLYYSINTFTRLGSTTWYPKDNFSKLETLEGVLGWIMLAIFLATLMHLLMRS